VFEGSAVDCGSSVSPGTSDSLACYSDDAEVLRHRGSWVDEMDCVMDRIAESAARKWEVALWASTIDAEKLTSEELDHYDK